MKFFFDANVSPKLVRALRVLCEGEGDELLVLQEHYPPDTPDVVWMRELASKGDCVVITGDVRISKGKTEKRGWHESGLTAFFLGGGWASKHPMDKASDLIGKWMDIRRLSKESEKGSGFIINKQGPIKPIYTPSHFIL